MLFDWDAWLANRDRSSRPSANVYQRLLYQRADKIIIRRLSVFASAVFTHLRETITFAKLLEKVSHRLTINTLSTDDLSTKLEEQLLWAYRGGLLQMSEP
jgi:hypothetical protein